MSYNPWINKQFPPSPYYNPVQPPPASFTIGGPGEPNLAPQPVPPPSAVFGKPVATPSPSHSESAEYGWRGQDRKRGASPDRLSGLSGHSNRSRYEEEGDFVKRSRLEVRSPLMGLNDSAMSSPASSFMASLAEEFPEWGVAGVVEEYLTATTGVIAVKNNMGGSGKVLFHVNQVWMPMQDSDDCSPFLETHPLSKLSQLLEPGQELKLNARRISGSSFSLQATAVWNSFV